MIVGVELALRSVERSPRLAVGLLAAGLALGGRGGLTTGALAVGLLCAWVRPDPHLERLDPGRVVTLEGVRLAPWRRGLYGWSAPVESRRISQGKIVLHGSARLWLVLNGLEPPPLGRGVRAHGYLSRPPPVGNGPTGAQPDFSLRVKSRRLVRLAGPRDRWLERLRRSGQDRSSRSDGVALARALALGDGTDLSPRLVRGLRRAGLGHLLALSGLHVGILAGLALWLGRLALGGRGRWQWLVPALAAVGFVAVVGPRPAVLRASVMALFAWAALARGSRPLSWHTLLVVLAAMVALEPERLRELGFLLTAAATAGILWQLGAGRRRPWASALRVSAAAQLFTMPWSLPSFHLFAPAALVHNLWAVPWTALALVLGGAWILVTAVEPALGGATEGVLVIAVEPFRWISRLPSGPWWSWPVAVTRSGATVLALGGALALRRRSVVIAAGVLAIFLVVAWDRPERSDPEMAMLDVGQGEAVLFRDGDSTVLVDGGGWLRGDIGGRLLVPALARLGVRRLRAVVLTHPDLDHCGGLVSLAGYLPVREVWTPAGWPPTRCLTDLISLPRVVWRPVWAGWSGRVGRWRLHALSPRPGNRAAGNDRSLVLRAEVRGFRVLLTGDIEAPAEAALLARTDPTRLRADLLKVAHHGSRSSTGEALLAAVAPRLALISAGVRNRYGHPHPAVLERLRERGVRMLRTDRDGLIHLRIGRQGSLHLTLPGTPKGSPPRSRG